MSKLFVLSLGGSLIVPDKINIDFLKEFKNLIERYIASGHRFIIVTGGGRTARMYQEVAAELSDLKTDDSDWIGINATRINAELVRSMFSDKAYKYIIKDPTSDFEFKEQILVAAGWKPGFSSDMDAVLLANKFKADMVINLSNVEFVYDKDPKLFSDAQKIERISWSDFRKLVGDKWEPGMNKPFDPVASKEAAYSHIKVIIAKGSDLANLERILSGEDFKGTIIS